MTESQNLLEKESSRRFAESFRRVVELGGNKNCSLKRHFRGVLREVVGYLDLMAAKHPETRFVYCSVDSIIEHCCRFDSKEVYKPRGVKYALEYLRRRHIVSVPLLLNCDGQFREGFIVAPHEHVTIQTSATKCRFVGMAAPFDCWEQSPTGEIFWINKQDSALHSALRCALSSAHNSALRGALRCALPSSAQQCTPEFSEVVTKKRDTS